MSYSIQQYRPKCSIVAYHGKTKYDLTPFLLQCTTHKGLGEPMGMWSLLLTWQRRWDQLLQVMDYVEIRMSRTAKSPVMIMRGFINNIRRTRVMNDSGNFRRAWTINGNDYGKLIHNYEIYYMANIPGQVLSGTDVDPAEGLLAPLLSENLGIFKNATNGIVPLNQFVSTLTDATLKPWILSLQKNTPAIPMLKTWINILPDYKINWLSLQSQQGGLDSVIASFANDPWCEWFVIDAEDGPKLIHRNAPLKDFQGRYIWQESALDNRYWGATVISDEDIKEDDIGTSDGEVYDYFFTYPSLFTAGDLAYKFAVIGANELGTGSDQSKYKIESDVNQATNPKVLAGYIYRYGLKIMEVGSPAIPVVDTSTPDNLSMQLSIKMNMWLERAFVWSPFMKNGTIRLKGNEFVNIGKYLYNRDMKEEYYVESVDHTFSISQPGSRGNDATYTFETVAGVTRGRYTEKLDGGVEPALSIPSLTVNTSLSDAQQTPNTTQQQLYDAYKRGLFSN